MCEGVLQYRSRKEFYVCAKIGTKRTAGEMLDRAHCPQILVMTDGDFAIVGLDIKKEAAGALPPGPGVSPSEGIVKIPRDVMVAAMADMLAVT